MSGEWDFGPPPEFPCPWEPPITSYLHPKTGEWMVWSAAAWDYVVGERPANEGAR